MEQNINNLIVTRGKDGSIFYDKKEGKFCFCDAFAKKSVDKVGAGDAMLSIIALCLKSNLNKELEIEGILITMYDNRLNLSRQVVQELQEYFVEKVYDTYIKRNVRLGEAPSHGKPILLYDATSTGAQNYMN